MRAVRSFDIIDVRRRTSLTVLYLFMLFRLVVQITPRDPNRCWILESKSMSNCLGTRDYIYTTFEVVAFIPGPGAKFEGLQRAADESGSGPCAQPMRLPGDPCRVGPKPRKAAPKTMSKQAGGGAGSDPRAKCGKTTLLLTLCSCLCAYKQTNQRDTSHKGGLCPVKSSCGRWVKVPLI